MDQPAFIDAKLEKKVIHSVFEVALFVKSLNGLWEITVGVLFFLFKEESIYGFIIALTGFPLIRHSDHAKEYLFNQASHFSLSTKYFLAFYFLFYGICNLMLMILLARGKAWAYPVAITFFIIFITYQCYRYILHQSGLLLIFTAFDIFLTILTWLEYQKLKKEPKNKGAL